MLFWHIGGVILLFRYVFRDPKVDVRFLALGALLPNLVDKPLGTIAFADDFGADRIYGHTLAFSTLIMIVTLLGTRRGRVRRQWMALAIGAMLHLVLDGMWASGAVLFWPLLGAEFPMGVVPYWEGFFQREVWSWGTIITELAGLLYLVYLWFLCDLSDHRARTTFLSTGRLPA